MNVVGEGGRQPRRGRVFLLVATALSLTMPLIVAALPQGQRLVVVMAPGAPPEALLEALRAADGRLVASSRFDWIALASSERSDFADRLRSAGAWLVLDGSLIAGCAPASS